MIAESHKAVGKFSAEQKAAILRCHFADKVPVSDLCDEYTIQPSVFYAWQRQMMLNLEAAWSRTAPIVPTGAQPNLSERMKP